jgi:hypothetical protein
MLVYLELAVSVGDDTPYPVCTGESIGAVNVGWERVSWRMSSLWIGRKLVVRVDPTERQRVAVDWEKSVRPGGEFAMQPSASAIARLVSYGPSTG